MRSLCALLFVMFVIHGVEARAQVITRMTPELIKEAISLADQKKSITDGGCYKIVAKKILLSAQIGCFTTPYSRVFLAAQSARLKYQTFTEADVTPELIAPEVNVHIFSQKLKDAPPTFANVETIVIIPFKSTDRSQTVQAIRTSASVATYQNGFGATYTGTGLTAVFPLEALIEDNEVRAIYDKPATSMLCSNCGSRFNLKGVR